MLDLNENYPKEYATVQCVGISRPMTLVEQFEHRKQKLEAELTDVNAAIAAITANPDVVLLIDTINRVRH